MILIDSSVWIDHLREPIADIVGLAEDGNALTHPYVIGEIALGSIKNRSALMRDFRRLPQTVVANDDEVLALIEGRKLFGRGIGYFDAHLLASTLLTDDARLWTFDRRLREAAELLGCAADLPGKRFN